MEYLAVTKKLTGRKTKQLISFNNKALSKDMIAIWEKTVLLQAGVDTSVSSAQNTWPASASATKNKGVSLDTIMCTAGSSNKGRFQCNFP